MCGRYSQTADLKTLAKRFGFPEAGSRLKKRYNIAPGQLAPLVLGARRLAFFKWGLTPKWADEKTGFRMINARAETVEKRRAYAGPFKKARCLVLADGFYEWRKANAAKTPFRFSRPDRAPFAFAGLYDNSTFTILTTSANGLVKPVHDRMPVILPEGAEGIWLDPKAKAGRLKELLAPLPEDQLEAHEVSTYVNSPKNDDEKCLAPLDAIEAAAKTEPPAPASPQMELF